MSAPPKTVLTASPGEARAIRAAVRRADLGTLAVEGVRLAGPTHVDLVVDLLGDPALSDPIYDLPRPFQPASIARWIAESEEEQRRGEALLVLIFAGEASLIGYAKITVWPERASGELGGGLRADRQSAGAGGAAFARTIHWMFSALGLRLICLTAAIGNLRSARMIDRVGFRRLGEREVVRPDGVMRRSIYWELARDDWPARL